MHRQNNHVNVFVQPLLWSIPCFFTSFLLVFPVSAHTTEISGDIAGTWHIEPNHSPKAGEPAQVWIALTQQGGTIVPLEQCNCQLTVYEGSTTNAAPMLKPPLQAIATDNYQGIPGTEIVFPQVGEYQLKLIGSPRAGASFQPFELTYTVTVATGKPPVTTTPTPQSQTTPQVSSPPSTPPSDASRDATPAATSNGGFRKGLIGLGAIALVMGAIGIVLRQQKAKKP